MFHFAEGRTEAVALEIEKQARRGKEIILLYVQFNTGTVEEAMIQ